MIQIQRFFLSIFLLAFAKTCLAVPAGVNWQWANPTPQGNPFNAVAHNPLGFDVAVGDQGNIVASSDGGVNWTVQNSNTTKNFNAIYTDANTAFIAVGDGGTIITESAAGSPPQLTGLWADFTDGSLTANLNDITRSDTATPLFVAVGDNGTVLTNDGGSLVWTQRTVPIGAGNLMAVEWSGVRFVAVSDTGKIIKSDNGSNWTSATTPSTAGLNDVLWTGSQFVAVGAKGLIVTSNDGISWAEINPATGSNFETLRSVAQLGSQLVAVGRFRIYVSANGGVNWILKPVTDGRELNGIVALNSQYLAVTRGGQILAGTDGVNWTRKAPDSSVTSNLKAERITDVVWNGDQFLAVGSLFDSSSNTVTLASADGINWTVNSSSSGAPDESVDWDGSQFIGAAASNVYASSDGVNWSVHTVASGINLNDVIFDGSQYIATDVNGGIYTSGDLVNWLPRASGTSNPLLAIATNNITTVVVGENATLMISQDGGANWTAPSLPAIGTVSLFDIVWNGSQFVTVGDSGTILTSSDGNNWAGRVSGVTGRLRGISWNGSQYIAVSGLGEIITSPDAATWTSQASNTTNVLTAVAGTDTKLVVVGWDGTIISSTGTVTTTSGSVGSGGGGGSFNLYLLMLLPGLFLLRCKR